MFKLAGSVLHKNETRDRHIVDLLFPIRCAGVIQLHIAVLSRRQLFAKPY
jgi:hypothetical protein